MNNNEFQDIPIPPISKQLIEALEEFYPPRDFTPTDSVCQLNFHYGQRAVVNFLKHHYAIQNETVIHNNKD